MMKGNESMKKKYLLTVLCFILSMSFLTGCKATNKKEESTNSKDSSSAAEDVVIKSIKVDTFGVQYKEPVKYTASTSTDYLSKETEKTSDDKNPVATIEMKSGDKIVVELYPETAPNTVRNFISLANSGFYDGVIFHRVISGFMIQGGDPTGTGTGGPDYSIYGEFSDNKFENNLKHERGVISMARTKDNNSAGSQFFIMHQDASNLDGQYAAFGKVTEGMDVVDKIAASKTDSNDKPIVIN